MSWDGRSKGFGVMEVENMRKDLGNISRNAASGKRSRHHTAQTKTASANVQIAPSSNEQRQSWQIWIYQSIYGSKSQNQSSISRIEALPNLYQPRHTRHGITKNPTSHTFG